MNEFIALVSEVWADSLFGVSPAELLTALGVFLTFAVLRGLFTRFVLGGLERLTQRTQTEIDDLLREALERPIKFFFLILGVFFALEVLPLNGLAEELADKVMRSLIAIGIFWSFYAASTPASMALKRIEDILSPEIVGWLLTLLRWGIVLTRRGHDFANLGYSNRPDYCRLRSVRRRRGAGRTRFVQKSARRGFHFD